MITEARAQEAVDFLTSTAEACGVARAQTVYMESWLKITKARLMGLSNEKSATAQERWALAHPDYEEAVKAQQAAIGIFETLRFRREAATAALSAFQTMSANQRGVRI
tara:strand:- start:640 stop:963 length:324 start_codon:yes stop_codon:yes gene_type:complete